MDNVKLLLYFICFFSLTATNAQEAEIEKGFAIIQSTKDYNAALKTVATASRKLNIPIDLRGYYPDQQSGLKTDIACGCGEVHDYLPRGRWDDGVYISIEYSNLFKGFSKDYYIVIIASNSKGSEQLHKALDNAKQYYLDAYIKTTSVYIGCMH
jgi:hypothetical protein